MDTKYVGTVECAPEYSYLKVKIPARASLRVEAAAMAAMDSHLVMTTQLRGGFGRFLTGESLFMNTFSAGPVSGEVSIAPGLPGDIKEHLLDGRSKLYLTSSTFLACGKDVQLNTKWQGFMKGIFSGESFFMMECSGSGPLWFNSFGAIIEVDVSDDYVVDTGAIVAFTEGLDYSIDKLGGYKSLFFSGEGLVAKFRGSGKLFIQSKMPYALMSWAQMYRPSKKG